MNTKDKDALLKIISENIGVGVHASLRKYCNSKEANEAWDAINSMPDEEWNMVSEIVAEVILDVMTPYLKSVSK